MVMKYIKDPGYIQDLFFIFGLYFNKDSEWSEFVNTDKASEDVAFFSSITAYFGTIPEKLYPFFYVKDKAKSFMMRHYFDAFESRFSTSYNLDVVQSALSDYNRVKNDLLYYYFDYINEEELASKADSLPEIGRFIEESKYSDRLKCGLYSFFVNPMATIQTLIVALAEKNVLLSEYYAKHYQKIVDFQAQLDTENLPETLQQFANLKVDLYNKANLYFSLCLVMKNFVKAFSNHEAVFLLGYDYKNILSVLKARRRVPLLDAFGTALSEPNRIEILDMIHRREEATIKDIEQELKIPGTTAYYHVNLMVKTGLLKFRVQKRVVYYSIDRSYFDIISEQLRQYTT